MHRGDDSKAYLFFASKLVAAAGREADMEAQAVALALGREV